MRAKMTEMKRFTVRHSHRAIGNPDAFVIEIHQAGRSFDILWRHTPNREIGRGRPYSGVCSPSSKLRGQGVEAALTLVHEALGLAGETGEHWTDAFLHRMRGEILLKRDPANTAPAEEAFLTAIAIFGLLLGLLAVATYQNYSNVGDIVDKEASSHIRAIF
jgi:hypothetical protein